MARATLIIAAAQFAAHALPAQRTPAELPRLAQAFVDARVGADSFSGVVLVARNGTIQYQQAAGLADRERGIAMQPDSKLQIASVSKLYTQIAIRQLEQAGKLALSDTVGKFLPEYPNAIVRSRVTIEQLLRHRSGVGSFWNERFVAQAPSIRTVRDYVELFQTDSLLFEPGTGEAYSNGGFVLLGAIIERVSGMAYHDYVRAKILGPAGMSETLPYDSQIPRSNAAIGYTFQNFDGPLRGDRRLAGAGPRPGSERRDSAPVLRPASRGPRRSNAATQAGMSSPAGGDYSTVGDFLKLAGALLTHKLLDSARTAAVLGPRYASGQDFRSNGGGAGTNAEFSIFPSGEVIVVLSNYDPPAATTVAQYLRSLVAPPPAAAPH